ncbi:TPA: translation initiation factor IF-2 N-terminal domain-containing protein, partial [Campylobacter jejuni]|nr:translation initiation factor IF-2 N-terminal domain-containing protein [Campylobacter jejuni]
MAKIRIHEIAKELGYDSKEIIEKANELGLGIKTASNAVEPEIAAAIYEYIQTREIPEAFKKNIKTPTAKKPKKENIKEQEKLNESEKKEPKKEEKLKQEVKKEELKIEKENAKEEEKQEIIDAHKPQSLASATLAKRRGLVIVKKKKDEEEIQVKKEEVKNSNDISINNEERLSLKTMFSNADESLKKKKKEKKSFVASKKESTEKMNFLDEHDFGDISLDDEDEVVLPDFSVKEQEKPQNINKKQPNFIRQAVGNSAGFGFEGGIQRRSRKKPSKKIEKKEVEEVGSVAISKEIRVYEFADKIGKSTSEVISKLFMLGMMTTKNDFLDEDAIEILAAEFGIEINIINEADEFDYVKDYEEETDEKDLVTRAPVITIMGHVDHGKTSLLDYIRKSRVASGEAGGITQHVGAYMVEKNGRKITFIDTPGHEAFTAMRARGASITDIVIIVVAADDGVKPQTKEAINHAKAAGVPIIIAINKMDKEAANPDMVKTQLAEMEIMPVEWGGSYEFVGVSAKTGMGIEDLLEIVLLQADILELKANPKSFAKASIIESSVQKGRGAVATVIVQNG